MAFLRNLLATILGLFIFFFLLLFLFGGIAASTETEPVVNDNSVLKMHLQGKVTERAIDDPFAEFIESGPPEVSLVDLLSSIAYAATDPRIQGIYLRSQFLQAGYASLKEIRDALLQFKESGKFIYAYGEYISESDFYLLSVADSLFLNPEGSLEFNGLSAGVTFYKGLFDKLDVEPEIFRVGEFKSFVEPFIRKDMSEENRLQLSELINSVYHTYLTGLSTTSGIAVSELTAISNQMKLRFPEDGESLGLVSKVAHQDALIDLLKSELNVDKGDDIKYTAYQDYISAVIADRTYSKNKVAVIIASGDIVMGEGDQVMGGAKFAREIRKARESQSIKAIVLRINSPGGSLTASDMIWREIMLTRQVKPVIASMSDVAASGGYYIAMPCDTIVAQPNTITGSIGIFGILFNLGDFLENKLGITNDRVNTGEFSDMMTVTRTLSPSERAIIQSQVEEGYRTFVSKVANARDLSVTQVKEIAGGRVWSGAQAFERGLVDVLGSYEDAVNIAAEMAGIADDFRVSYYPRQRPLLEELFTKLNEAEIAMGGPNPLKPYLEKLESLENLQGIQARLPGNLEIH